VTLYKGHLGVGVTEPSGQLELAGDERIQEYPPRGMTNKETLVEGHGVFCTYSSEFTPLIPILTWQQAHDLAATLTGGNATYEPIWYDSRAHHSRAYYGADTASPAVWTNDAPSEFSQLLKTVDDLNRKIWIFWHALPSGVTPKYSLLGYDAADGPSPSMYQTFNKNDALTDYWESVASTYTSTSGGSPAVSTERLASNTPYGSWVTLKLPYKICLKRYEFIGPGTKSPKEGQIWGSTDGTTWSHVHTFTDGVTDVKNNETVSGNTNYYSEYAFITTKITGADTVVRIVEIRYFGTPGPTTLDKGSLTLGRSLDVPRISRYDVDTETPRPEKLVVDFDTTVNSSPFDISGKGNHGTFQGNAVYSAPDKAFKFDGNQDFIETRIGGPVTTPGGPGVISGSNPPFTASVWIKYSGSEQGYVTPFSIEPLTYGTNTNVWLYILESTGKPTLQFENNYVEFSEPGTSTGGATSNTWHHLAVTFNGSSAIGGRRCWLNGIEQVSSAVAGSAAGGTLTLGTTRLTIGSMYYNNAHIHEMIGFISNFKLYNVALEASEVKKLYRLGRTGRSMVISDTAVGIGKAPEAQLDVRGNMNVDGVITTPQRPVFYAYHAANGGPTHGGAGYTHNTANGYTGIIRFTAAKINVGNCFKLNDYKFHAPITGYYWFEFSGLAREGTGNGHLELTLFKNGANAAQRSFAYTYVIGNDDHDFIALHLPLFCNAGDNVYPAIHSCAPGVNLYFGEDIGHFSGYFIG